MKSINKHWSLFFFHANCIFKKHPVISQVLEMQLEFETRFLRSINFSQKSLLIIKNVSF